MRTRNEQLRRDLAALLRKGPSGARALAERLEVSPRTVLRLLGELGDACCSGGAAGRTRYALNRMVRGIHRRLPLYAVDEAGRLQDEATLQLIEPQGCLCALSGSRWPVADESRDGWWGGLPYPLYDMQPQGYLGRQLARAAHVELEVPEDPRRWDDEDIVFVLSRRGADVSGNLILGERSALAWQRELLDEVEPLSSARLAEAYCELADRSASLGVAGSSAAGEFPKFTTMRDGGQQTPHVIVKFSAAGDAGRRWSDLLVCEYLALEAAATLPGVAVASSRLLQAGGRTFLESERFDRVGRFGRRAFVSLQSLSAHLLGLGVSDWRIHAQALADQGFVDAAALAAVERLWCFGRLIANGDMHLGNLGFLPRGDGGLAVAPAYDMLPMSFAPLAGGEIPTLIWQPPLPLPAELGVWGEVAGAAIRFWRQAAGDGRISPEFRSICADNAVKVERIAERLLP